MQERVTPVGDDIPDLIVQFNHDLEQVGIGMEPRKDVPSKHMIDQIYGNANTQTMIGKIFRERIKEDRHIDIHEGYSAANAEEVLDNQLGRMILDAVTGSVALDGWWTWLDRPACNRLIRLIKKARDTAFGRDE